MNRLMKIESENMQTVWHQVKNTAPFDRAEALRIFEAITEHPVSRESPITEFEIRICLAVSLAQDLELLSSKRTNQ